MVPQSKETEVREDLEMSRFGFFLITKKVTLVTVVLSAFFFFFLIFVNTFTFAILYFRNYLLNKDPKVEVLFFQWCFSILLWEDALQLHVDLIWSLEQWSPTKSWRTKVIDPCLVDNWTIGSSWAGQTRRNWHNICSASLSFQCSCSQILCCRKSREHWISFNENNKHAHPGRGTVIFFWFNVPELSWAMKNNCNKVNFATSLAQNEPE